MAVVNAIFDTNEKTLVVTIDGRPMSDVDYVSFMKDYDDKDKSRMTLQMERRDFNGMMVETSVYASDIKYTEFASEDKTLVDNKTNATPEMHRLTKAIKNNLK